MTDTPNPPRAATPEEQAAALALAQAPPVLKRLDGRNRISLTEVALPGDRYFLVQRDKDGTIVLVPAEAVARKAPALGENPS